MLDTVTAKKRYSVRELYDVTYDALRTAPLMRKARKDGLTRALIERVMLAVTGVNGCALCAWAHVKIALETGLGDEEISRMLDGDISGVPAGDAVAVAFAEHYADTRGHPSPEAWRRVVNAYGPDLATGILGATRAIMWGNVAGIPATSFLRRLRGQADRDSSLWHELSMILATALVMPVAFLHAIMDTLRGVPVARFGKEG